MPAYLTLLNLMPQAPQAVVIVANCLGTRGRRRNEVGALLNGGHGWRQQLIGCVAVLASEPSARPLDELRAAAMAPSWVAPQSLATPVLLGEVGWEKTAAEAMVARNDSKAAAALVSLVGDVDEGLTRLADLDTEHGREIATSWRDGIREAFDSSGLGCTW